VRHLVAAYLEYKVPPDADDDVEWVARRKGNRGRGMTKEAIAAMYGGARGVRFANAADDPVVRAAFPEHFGRTGTDG
jgi:hypothetical protein